MRKSDLKQIEEVNLWFFIEYDGSSGEEFASESVRARWTATHVDMLVAKYQELKEENEILRMKNQKLNQELETARAQSDSEALIEARDLPRDEAKKEIAQFFDENRGEVIYPSDVAEALNLSYFLVEEIIEDYLSELKIPVIANFAYGHDPIKLTLPIGVKARLITTEGCLTITESTVEN